MTENIRDILRSDRGEKVFVNFHIWRSSALLQTIFGGKDKRFFVDGLAQGFKQKSGLALIAGRACAHGYPVAAGSGGQAGEKLNQLPDYDWLDGEGVGDIFLHICRDAAQMFLDFPQHGHQIVLISSVRLGAVVGENFIQYMLRCFIVHQNASFL